MKKIKAIIILMACTVLLAGCSGGIRGSWSDEQGVIYQFSKKDVMSIVPDEDSEPLPAKYYLKPDGDKKDAPLGEITIEISTDGKKDKEGNFENFETFNGRYKLEEKDKKLTITGEDGSESVLFK